MPIPATGARSAPRLVLMLSEVWTLVDARDLSGLVELAVVAERAGVDGVLVGEHVTLGARTDAMGVAENPRDWVRPGNQQARYPHPHGLHILGAMAAVTSRIRLIASALLTPFRHPLVLGKELATVDLISRGRLVYMPVPGSVREEYDALEVPFHRRGEIFDEQLEIWERAWRDDVLSFHGKHYRFENMAFEPKPWRPEGPTMWIGGNRLHARSLRRLVRYGSGYFPVLPPSAEELERLAAAMSAAGRSTDELELVWFIGQRTAFPDATSPKALAPALDDAVAELKAGIGTFVLKPSQYVDDIDDFGDLCRAAVTGLAERADAATA